MNGPWKIQTILLWIEMKVYSYMVGGKIINSRAQYPWVQIMSTAHTSCKATSLNLRNANSFSSNEQRYKSLEADDMFSEWKWCKEERATGGSSRKEGGEGGKKGKKNFAVGNTNFPQACVILVGRSVAFMIHCEAICSGKVTLSSGPGGGCVSQRLFPVSGPQACSMGTPAKIYLIINRSSGLGTQQHWVTSPPDVYDSTQSLRTPSVCQL